MNNEIHNSQRGGFTLVEMIIAAGLFAFAISIVIGVFSQSLRSQRLLNSLIQRNSNAGLMIEQMMREIRVGYSFSDVGSGCKQELTFKRFGDAVVTYKLNSSTGNIERWANGVVDSILNSSSINIDSICFRVSQGGAELPWKITILLRIGSKDARLAGKVMNVQTTVSARTLPRDTY